MADSKHTITIKSEDSGKSRGVGGSGDVGGGDFLKIFQQEVAKLKEAILRERPELTRGEAQREAQQEVSRQLAAAKKQERDEGRPRQAQPTALTEEDEYQLQPVSETTGEEYSGYGLAPMEEEEEDIRNVRAQSFLKEAIQEQKESGDATAGPAFGEGVAEVESVKADPKSTLVQMVGQENADALAQEQRRQALTPAMASEGDEGDFDDADDQLQDDVEGSAEASDTEEEDETKQLVAASTEEEDKSSGFFQRQGGKLGGAAAGAVGGVVGGTVGAIGGAFAGNPMVGAKIGASLGSSALKPIGKAIGQGVGAIADGATQLAGDAVQTTTGDATGAAAATAGGFATASEGVLKAFGDLGGMIPGIGGILETAFDGLAEAIGPIAEGFVQLFSAMDKASEEVAAFNPGILGERIETDLDMLFKKMERAQQAGDEFAEFEAAKGDMMSVFEDVKTGLFKILGPLVTLGTKLLTRLLELFLDWLPTIGEFIAALLEGLAWIVDWFDGSGVSEAQQAILDTAVSVRKAAKEVEQWHDEDKEKEQKNYMGEIDQWLTGGFLENDHIGAVGPAPPGVL